MKTAIDMKRDLVIGKKIKLVQFSTPFVVNNKNLDKIRYIVKIQGSGVYLNEDKNATTGSYLEFPKASLLDYDGKTIKVYDPCLRDLTKEEQFIRDNEPRDPKQEEIDILTDGSQMYYRCKQYYKEKGYEYLFLGNSKPIKGKYLTTNEGRIPKIRDDSIKGNISLIYEIVE